jgi:hypothetical protein
MTHFPCSQAADFHVIGEIPAMPHPHINTNFRSQYMQLRNQQPEFYHHMYIPPEAQHHVSRSSGIGNTTAPVDPRQFVRGYNQYSTPVYPAQADVSQGSWTSGLIVENFDTNRGLVAPHFQGTLARPEGNLGNKDGWSRTTSGMSSPGTLPNPPARPASPLMSACPTQLTPIERALAVWIKKSKTTPAEEKARYFADMTGIVK